MKTRTLASAATDYQLAERAAAHAAEEGYNSRREYLDDLA